MEALAFAACGKTKHIERQLFLKCHHCGVTLQCPPEKDPWAWLKCGDALDFFKLHDHGNPRLTGAQIVIVEKDD